MRDPVTVDLVTDRSVVPDSVVHNVSACVICGGEGGCDNQDIIMFCTACYIGVLAFLWLKLHVLVYLLHSFGLTDVTWFLMYSQVVRVTSDYKHSIVAALLTEHKPRRAIVFNSSRGNCVGWWWCNNYYAYVYKFVFVKKSQWKFRRYYSHFNLLSRHWSLVPLPQN